MNYTFLKSLNENELMELEQEIKKEVTTRQPKQEFVKYEHDCHNAGNSKYHFKKYQHWAKLINDIDMTKSNGFAFIGKFLSVSSQELVPINSVIVEKCGNDLKCYRMTSQGKKLIVSGSIGSMVDFIMLVKQEL